MSKSAKTNKGNPFDVTGFVQGLKVPEFDIESLMAMQRRNVEAIWEANRVAAQGYQSLLNRNVEIIQSTLEDASETFQKATSADPAGNGAEQLEAVRSGFDKVIQNLRDLTEMAQETNTESFRIMQDRMRASLDEWRQLASSAS